MIFTEQKKEKGLRRFTGSSFALETERYDVQDCGNNYHNPNAK